MILAMLWFIGLWPIVYFIYLMVEAGNELKPIKRAEKRSRLAEKQARNRARMDAENLYNSRLGA